MAKPSGIPNFEAKAASLELLPRAIKAKAIAKGAFPTVREIVEEAGNLSGRTLSTGWLYSCLGQDGNIKDFAASQGIYEAVVVDGSVYSPQTTDELPEVPKATDVSGEQNGIVDKDLNSLPTEQLHQLLGSIGLVLAKRIPPQ